MPVKKGGRNLLAIDECRSKVLLEGPGWVIKSTWRVEQTAVKLKEIFQLKKCNLIHLSSFISS
jgi:hypothetical protein